MLALQKLGEQLLHLPQKELDNMALPEQLMDALQLAGRINNREGRRRQLQYIGKIMRRIDAEPIRQRLLQREQGEQEKNHQYHLLEQLRDDLISEGMPMIEQALHRFPAADRTRLSQLVRSARKEKQRQQPPKSARNLFRYLRELAQFQGRQSSHLPPPEIE